MRDITVATTDWPITGLECLATSSAIHRPATSAKKSKPQRHAAVGLPQPIPIPTPPFKVVLMDFISELPDSDGFNNILVIVDTLTKYKIFIPCSTKITDIETTQLFFKHVVTHFGLPCQVITNRDT